MRSAASRRILRAEFGAAYAAIMAVAVLNVLPALAGVLSRQLRWDEKAIGLFAAADSLGALLGTVIAALQLRRRSARALTTAGMALLAGADLLSALSSGVALTLGARFAGGLGGGIAMGVAFAVFARSQPERGVALWSIGQLLFGFIAITALPGLTAALGWQSAFVGLAVLAACGIAAARCLPAQSVAGAAERKGARVATIAPYAWLGVFGVALFYLGQGSLWPYLEVIGVSSGIAQQSVETSVSVSAASAILGSVFVLLVGKRLGRNAPLLAAFMVTIVAVWMLRSPDAGVFRAALAAFTFAWPVFAAYQFALIVADHASERLGAFVTTANFAGLVAGPFLSGELIGPDGLRSAQWLATVADALALASLLPLMGVQRLWRARPSAP